MQEIRYLDKLIDEPAKTCEHRNRIYTSKEFLSNSRPWKIKKDSGNHSVTFDIRNRLVA